MVPTTPPTQTSVEEVKTLPAEAPIEQKPTETAPEITTNPDLNTEANRHEELLKGVDDVLKKAPEAPAAEKPEVPTEAPVEAEKPAVEAAPVEKVEEKPSIDPTLLTDADKEDDKLEFKDHPRFVALRQEAIQSRAAVKAFENQVAPLRESAEKLSTISGFVHNNGISENEFIEGLEIMAALKNDPLKAAQLLAPHIAHLHKFTGEGALPQDLEDRVSSGELSEAAAREIIRAKTQASVAQAQAQRITAEQQNAYAQRNLIEAGNAVTAWEAQISKTDLDYAKKQPLVIRLIQSEAALNPPRNPTEAVALAQRCYSDVTKNFVSQVTKPATKPTPSTTSSSQARTVVLPKPKSLLDGVGQVLAGIRG
jgi:hypothetical protein